MDWKFANIPCIAFQSALVLAVSSNWGYCQDTQLDNSASLNGPILFGPQLIAPPLQPLIPRSETSQPKVNAGDFSVAIETEPEVQETIDPTQVLPEAASKAMYGFLASIIRENIPEKHTEDKEWNRTKEIYAGIKFRREGLKIETERRWKTVNHGLWRKYEVQLIDPDNRLTVRLSDVHWQPDGRLHAHLTIIAETFVTAWQTQWNLGIRVYAIRSEAKITMQLDVDATIGFGLDNTAFPPALVVDPHIHNASLQMSSFHVDRIGKLGGDISEELGDSIENLVRKLVVKPQSEKLAAKLNRQIDKKRDDLRIEAGDWLNRWFED